MYKTENKRNKERARNEGIKVPKAPKVSNSPIDEFYKINEMSAILTNDDFHKICRTCLEVKKNMTSLFMSEIVNMLETCTTITVKENDGLPRNICLDCIDKINDIYSFKTKCEESDRLLHRILKDSIKEENSQKPENYDVLTSNLDSKSDCGGWLDEDSQSSSSKTNNENSCHSFKNLDSGIKQEIVEQNNLEQNSRKDSNLDTILPSSGDAETKNKWCIEDGDSDNNSVRSSNDNSCNDDNPDDFNSFGFDTSKMIKETLKEKDTERQKRKEYYDSLRKKFFNTDKCDKDTLTCNLCKKTYASSHCLLRHMDTHDQDRKFQYYCDVCNKGFYEKGQMIKHKRRHVGATRHKCEKCPKEFYEPSALARHMRKHLVEPSYACTSCNKKFMVKVQLELHMRSHKSRVETCKECGIKTAYLRTHIYTHLKERMFPCQLCDKSFKVIDALKSHHRRCHYDQTKVECEICGKTVTSLYIQKHLQIHKTEKTFECAICSRQYRTMTDLKVHQKRHEKKNAKLRALCTLCGKQCTSEATLKIHMRSHTGERPYSCSQCDKSFANRSGLFTHTRTHTGEKPYVCTICQKAFTTKTCLNKHVMIHTGEKPHSCHICGKGFIQKSQMKTHMKVHSNAIP